MNTNQLEKLAAQCGVQVVTTDEPDWGGKWCYIDSHTPHVTNMGYRTRKQALEAWLRDTIRSEELYQYIKRNLKL